MLLAGVSPVAAQSDKQYLVKKLVFMKENFQNAEANLASFLALLS